MRIAITGSSGLIGSALRRDFAQRGWQVTRITRSKPAADAIRWDPATGRIDRAGLESHDAVIHLAGESIAGLWTAGRKKRIRESRELGTELLSQALAGLSSRPAVLLSASAVGYYGDHPADEPVPESTPAGSGFLADVCVRWEAATRFAADAGIRVVNMRNGNVLSTKGGALPVLLPAFRLGLGATLGDGRQMFPWISLEDMTGGVLHLLEKGEIEGPVNVVAPEAVSNEVFTRTLATVLHRPAWLKVPEFALRLAPGGMGEEMLLGGAQVVPAVLQRTGFRWSWPTLKPLLEDEVGSGG